jgi:hypothetical protein
MVNCIELQQVSILIFLQYDGSLERVLPTQRASNLPQRLPKNQRHKCNPQQTRDPSSAVARGQCSLPPGIHTELTVSFITGHLLPSHQISLPSPASAQLISKYCTVAIPKIAAAAAIKTEPLTPASTQAARTGQTLRSARAPCSRTGSARPCFRGCRAYRHVNASHSIDVVDVGAGVDEALAAL